MSFSRSRPEVKVRKYGFDSLHWAIPHDQLFVKLLVRDFHGGGFAAGTLMEVPFFLAAISVNQLGFAG